MSIQYTQTGASNLAYRIDGNADRPWLVLSNSLATDHTMWDPQMETLTRSHRVLRYDTRGHGRSSVPPGPYALNELVTDAVGLMNALGITQASFMGLSLGGMTAIGLALDHSDRLDRIICCDARADAPQMYRQMWPGMIARAREAGMGAMVEPTLDRWLREEFRNNPDNQVTCEATADMIRSTPVEGYAGCAMALTGLDYLKRLPEITLPTLYIVGESDAAAPRDVMQNMAEVTPGAEFSEISNAAHLSNIEQPELFNNIVSNWL